MARTAKLRQVRWDPKLKLAEHLEFFIRAKDAGIRVWCDPTVKIIHDHKTYNHDSYRVQRWHKWCIGFEYLLNKHDIDIVHYSNGKKRYRETITELAKTSRAILQNPGDYSMQDTQKHIEAARPIKPGSETKRTSPRKRGGAPRIIDTSGGRRKKRKRRKQQVTVYRSPSRKHVHVR